MLIKHSNYERGEQVSNRIYYLDFHIPLCHCFLSIGVSDFRSSHPDVFLGKGVLKICNKFIRVYPCRSAISILLLCNFIEITLRHGCSPVNLLHIFRTIFLPGKTSGWLPLKSEQRTHLGGCFCDFIFNIPLTVGVKENVLHH